MSFRFGTFGVALFAFGVCSLSFGASYTPWDYSKAITVPARSGETVTANFARNCMLRLSGQDYLVCSNANAAVARTEYFLVNGAATATPAATNISLGFRYVPGGQWPDGTTWPTTGNSNSIIQGLVAAPGGGYFATILNTSTYAWNRTIKVKADGTIDSAWGNNGVYSYGLSTGIALGPSGALPDGRLMVCTAEGPTCGIIVLKADGSGEAGRISGLPTNVRAFCIKDNTTAFFATEANPPGIRRVTFDATTFADAVVTPFASILLTGSNVGLAYNAVDNTVVCVSDADSATFLVYDADDTSGAPVPKQTFPNINRGNVSVSFAPDGPTGQAMYVQRYATREFHIYTRATVPVTLSGFELD